MIYFVVYCATAALASERQTPLVMPYTTLSDLAYLTQLTGWAPATMSQLWMHPVA